MRMKPGNRPRPRVQPTVAGAARRGANIYEVARKAGVSIVTVSRVFNHYPHVSPAMRERVLAAARAAGYRPKFTVKRRTLAILVSELMTISSGDLYSCLALELMQAATGRDYLIEFLPARRAEMATQNLVNGVVALGFSGDALQGLQGLPDVPKASFGPHGPVLGWHSVMVDPATLVETAAQHLLEMGHRELAMVHDHNRGWLTEQRRRGLMAALQRAGLHEAQDVHASPESQPVEVARQVRDRGATACLCLCDYHGLPLLNALQNDLGLQVPEDLSIVALEHKDVSAYLKPRLTTMAIPLATVSHALLDNVERAEYEKTQAAAPTLIPSRLLIRDSVRRLA